jgi:FlaA1/EpsC-like NDP-sugar epimerase
VDGAGSIVALRNVPPEELLPRPRFTADPQHLRRAVAGRRFLVTGAAGSIGSELCRSLCRLGAAHVTLLDRAESPMHDLLRELRSVCGDVEITAALVDILEAPRLKDAVERARPDVIFHAAAYKHVPLMEERPLEAARNNVLGTLRVAQAAEEAGVPRAVLISTDKAVRPASIMGATKRIAEEMVLRRAGPTRWSAVRFGNVIGSQGSVLRVFEAQLYDGKPLTVTSEKATRYFILPSEAVHLLILAADIAKPGDLLVLDMGRPVAIGDLARNLVRLAGLRPGRDIALERTGLKPGEKTEEELTDEGERLEATSVPRVWRVCAQTAPPFITQEDIHRLLAAAEQFDEQNARALLCSSVRTRGDCVPSTGTSVPEGR